MYCGKCGKQNADDINFCIHCGSDLTRQTPRPANTIGNENTVADGGQVAQAPVGSTAASSPFDTLDAARTIRPGELYTGIMLANQFRITGGRPLGTGGMGEVWLAEDTHLGVSVAVKVLPALFSQDRASVENLRREALIGRQLTHSNICRLHSFHTDSHITFIVMEYVDGKTLAQLTAERPDRRMTWAELQPIARQVAAALDFAHATTYKDAAGRNVHGVLHRDIKPANIMVTAEGTAKLMDFGIAREIHNTMTMVTGRSSMTPLYASPEQYRGEQVTAASDIFSFASVMYECLAGKPAVSPHGDIAWQILNKPYERIDDVPDEVNERLLAGLAKKAERRPDSACQLMDALTAKQAAPAQIRIDQKPVIEPPPKPRVEPQPPSSQPPPLSPAKDMHSPRPAAYERKSPFKWVAAIIIICVVGIGLAVMSRDDTPSPPVRPPATTTTSTRQQATPPPRERDTTPAVQTHTPATVAQPRTTTVVPPTRGDVMTNSIGMKLVYIAPGEYMRGGDQSPEEVVRLGGGDISWYRREHPQHRVTLTKGFYMATTPVTQAQWQAVMGNNPSHFKGNDRPVEQVSWNDAVEFCRKLSQKEGKRYRLPTEAEWEYACRAGTTTPFHFGNTISTDQANYDGNYTYGSGRKGVYIQQTTAVGSFPPNAWGLYDMHGNVWEWCADWYGEYPVGPVTDPKGPATGQFRVLRGGSWFTLPWSCRSAVRRRYAPGGRSNDVGFRVLLDLE